MIERRWTNSLWVKNIWVKLGHPKPHAATRQGWKEWRNKAKKEHRLAYFILNDCLQKAERISTTPSRWLNRFLFYVRVWRTQSSYIRTPDSKWNRYSDLCYKVEAGLFYEFEAFVDNECAWMHNIGKHPERNLFQEIKSAWTHRNTPKLGIVRDGVSYMEYQRDYLVEEKQRFVEQGEEIPETYTKTLEENQKAWQDLIDVYFFIKTVYNPYVSDNSSFHEDDDEFMADVQKNLIKLVTNYRKLWT